MNTPQITIADLIGDNQAKELRNNANSIPMPKPGNETQKFNIGETVGDTISYTKLRTCVITDCWTDGGYWFYATIDNCKTNLVCRQKDLIKL